MNTWFAIFMKYIVMLLSFGGLILVPLGFPGTWIMVGSVVLYAYFWNFQSSDAWVVGITCGLAVLAEILEWVSNYLSTKNDKVPTGAFIASIIGGIIGAIITVPVLIIGSLLGLLIGTFLGTLAYSLWNNPHDLPKAVQMATSILFSRIISIFVKTSIAVFMIIYIGFKLF